LRLQLTHIGNQKSILYPSSFIVVKFQQNRTKPEEIRIYLSHLAFGTKMKIKLVSGYFQPQKPANGSKLLPLTLRMTTLPFLKDLAPILEK